MIHDDEVRVLRALVHGGDEAAVEFRALLAGAQIAARVDAIPKVGVVGKKSEFVAIAGFGKLRPVANLREPVHFVDALQHRLPVHLVHLLTAQKIGAALHQRGFQVGSEMLLQERDVFLEELLLQRFRGRRNDHAPSAANRGQKVSQRLARAGAGFDQGVLVFLEGLVGHLGHGQLRRAEFVSGMAFFEQTARPEDAFDGDFLRFCLGSFLWHALGCGDARFERKI